MFLKSTSGWQPLSHQRFCFMIFQGSFACFFLFISVQLLLLLFFLFQYYAECVSWEHCSIVSFSLRCLFFRLCMWMASSISFRLTFFLFSSLLSCFSFLSPLRSRHLRAFQLTTNRSFPLSISKVSVSMNISPLSISLCLRSSNTTKDPSDLQSCFFFQMFRIFVLNITHSNNKWREENVLGESPMD